MLRENRGKLARAFGVLYALSPSEVDSFERSNLEFVHMFHYDLVKLR